MTNLNYRVNGIVRLKNVDGLYKTNGVHYEILMIEGLYLFLRSQLHHDSHQKK